MSTTCKLVGTEIRADGTVGENMTVFVSDGKWLGCIAWNDVVCSVHNYRVIGVDSAQTSAYLSRPDRGDPEFWTCEVIADHPFAIVLEEQDWEYRPCKRFSLAKQLKNGVPANDVRISHPEFVRGAEHWRWVNLGILAEFAGIDILEFWHFYFKFQNYLPEEYGMEIGATKFYLTVAVDDCRSNQLIRRASENVASQVSLNRLWVPAGWAMNILRLRYLGLKP